MLPTATPQVTARSRIIRRLMLTLLARFPRTLFRLFGPPQSLHETNRMTLVPRKVPPRGCATGPLCSPNSSPDGSPPFPSLSPRAAPLCDGDPTKSRASHTLLLAFHLNHKRGSVKRPIYSSYTFDTFRV